MGNSLSVGNKETTITVYESVKQKLEQLKGQKSWNEYLLELADNAIASIEEETIVTIPRDLDIDNTIVEAIEEVKPPSKWGDLVKFLALGILAGIGLGMVIPW